MTELSLDMTTVLTPTGADKSSPSPAKVAIHALCEALAAFGVSPLDPEAVRQAKFDGPVVSAPACAAALHCSCSIVLISHLDLSFT